jgi:uncharacterized Zn finger protein
MDVTPKCPYCDSTDAPKSVRQEHDQTTVLVLYCASCGSILAAADLSSHFPELRNDQP